MKRDEEDRSTEGTATAVTADGSSARVGTYSAATEAAGTASAGRQQAETSLSAGVGALPPGQQGWLAPVGIAHKGATQATERTKARSRPTALRIIT